MFGKKKEEIPKEGEYYIDQNGNVKQWKEDKLQIPEKVETPKEVTIDSIATDVMTLRRDFENFRDQVIDLLNKR